MHISEERVSATLDKLAYMETLVNDRLLQDRNTITTTESINSSPSTSKPPPESIERKTTKRKGLNVSGPVPPYHPNLKNFWYPVAFSKDLKEDTLVSHFSFPLCKIINVRFH